MPDEYTRIAIEVAVLEEVTITIAKGEPLGDLMQLKGPIDELGISQQQLVTAVDAGFLLLAAKTGASKPIEVHSIVQQQCCPAKPENATVSSELIRAFFARGPLSENTPA